MEEDRRRGSASCQKVDEAGEGVKSLGSPIRGGAANSLLKMTRAQARGPRGRVVGELSHSLEDSRLRKDGR